MKKESAEEGLFYKYPNKLGGDKEKNEKNSSDIDGNDNGDDDSSASDG